MKSLCKFAVTILTAAILTAGCSSNEQAENKPPEKENKPIQTSKYELRKAVPQQIDHIHGLGYPGNDNGLYVASHEGIKVFNNGQWFEGTSQKHDYMGFQATKNGFFASGHPEEGSNLKDPLGLVKSLDKGASLQKLAFYGESDFHFLAAGYNTGMLYIINEKENSDLKAGVFRSENEGKTWEPVKLNGFTSDTLGMISAHPSNSNIMAMATRNGIYFSEDKGRNMKRITDDVMTTALSFSEDALYYSSVVNNKVLFNKIDLKTLKQSQLDIPFLNYDNPVIYISSNKQTLAFATYLNDIYESADDGENWNLILKNGRIK